MGFIPVPVAIISTVTAMRGYSHCGRNSNRFRVVRRICDFTAELVALTELLPDDLNDVVGVAVRLGKNERFGYFLTVRKQRGKGFP